MRTNTTDLTSAKRELMFRDSMIFLSLTAITVVLFVITLFLFRSFQHHRIDLAKRWSDRGLAAFRSHRSDQAITSYRTALSYAPAERKYQLMLAESLAQAGRTEESYNYFLGLREEKPGDGFINLQLARLATKKRDVQGAVDFYRASIYGNWEGDGIVRRREVRLELARYFIEQQQLGPAKTELLIASGNAPDDPDIEITLARLLEQTGASSDALDLYQKALANQPENYAALSGAGRLGFDRGDYTTALTLLERAVRQHPENEANAALAAKARRIVQLMPDERLPARERVERILASREIAKKRWTTCALENNLSQDLLQSLGGRWASQNAKADASTLLHDSDKQKVTLQLIYDTEKQTSSSCEAATEDDALLLRLAQSSVLEGSSHH